MSLTAALKPAGTNGNVCASRNGGKKSLGLFHWRREVGIGEHHDFALGLQQPGAHAIPFAAVAGILDQPNLGCMFGKGPHQLRRGIAGAVVDNDHLRTPLVSPDAGHYRLKRRRNTSALVVGRDHDAICGIFRHSKITAPASQPVLWRDSGHHICSGGRMARSRPAGENFPPTH